LIILPASGLFMILMPMILIGIPSIIRALDLAGAWALAASMVVMVLAMVDFMVVFIIHFLAGVCTIHSGADIMADTMVWAMVMVAVLAVVFITEGRTMQEEWVLIL